LYLSYGGAGPRVTTFARLSLPVDPRQDLLQILDMSEELLVILGRTLGGGLVRQSLERYEHVIQGDFPGDLLSVPRATSSLKRARSAG
jgi:hypothetical protein